MPTTTSLHMCKAMLSMTLPETLPSVTSSTYADAKTGIFWDAEECPIPEDLDLESVYRNIRTALANKGYRGEVKIMAFGDRNQIPGYYEAAGIKMYPQGDKFERIGKMQLKFFGWMRKHKSEYTNMMVISRSAMELAFALEYKETHHNILFANPLYPLKKACGCKHGAGSEDPSTETWVWETLALGGDPTTKTEGEEEELCVMKKGDGGVKDSVST